MIASLPMYATPRTDASEARFWTAIRARLAERGLAAPDRLTRTIPDLFRHWRDPGLVFSQTCGMPFRVVLHPQVHLVGTPDFGIEGCPPGYYRSLVIARAEDTRRALSDFAGATFAFNDALSQSGWAALANEAPELLTGPRLRTGAHAASARAVREGRADFAAIDAVTFRNLEPAGETSGLRTVHATPPTPGLPYITASGRDAAATCESVRAALESLPTADRETLGIRDIVEIPAEAYLSVPTPEAPTPES